MGKIKDYTGYLKKRFLINASSTQEQKIKDFIDAHKLPKSFYVERRLREMDGALIQTRKLEETLNKMTEKRRLIVEWNLSLNLNSVVKILKIFTNSSGAISYIVDQNTKTHLLVVMHIQEKVLHKHIGEAFRISDCLCLATSAAWYKEIFVSPYLNKDYRFPLGNGWPESDANIGLAAPIVKNNGQVIAVIELTKSMYSNEYSGIDTEAVSLLTSLFGYLSEESDTIKEMQMLLTFINPMMVLITQYLECTLPVATIISQLTFMSKNEIGAVNSSFCVKKTIRNQQYNIIYTEDNTNPHCHEQTSRKYSSRDKSFLGYSMRSAKTIKRREKEGQNWSLGIPIRFNEVTGGIQFQFLCSQEPNFSEKNVKLLETTCTFLGFILEMNELGDELFKHEKEMLVIEDILKIQACNCNHELTQLQDASDSNYVSDGLYSYAWCPEITNEKETILIQFRNFVEQCVGHLFYDRKSLNEFIIFIRRTHTQNKEISYRHTLVTTHFIATFLMKNEAYFSPIERDALLMSALCHVIHKFEPFYSFVSIFKTFRICEKPSKPYYNRLLNTMKRWKYFYPCNHLGEKDLFNKKHREIVNLIAKKMFNDLNKWHRELIIQAIIINADKSMYYKHKVFMSHHDELCFEWNIEFSLCTKENDGHIKELWTPQLLNKTHTDEYQSKKLLTIDLISSVLQPWLNILKILFDDTECLQPYLDNNIRLLKQQEKEIKDERRKTFMFTTKPPEIWGGLIGDLRKNIQMEADHSLE